MIIAILIILIFLAIAAVAGRLLSRRITGIKFWWDDYLIIGALVTFYLSNSVGAS